MEELEKLNDANKKTIEMYKKIVESKDAQIEELKFELEQTIINLKNIKRNLGLAIDIMEEEQFDKYIEKSVENESRRNV